MRKTQWYLQLLILFFLITGCKEITFREPQPKGKKALKANPKKIQGKYLAVEDDGEISKDTIVITENGYHVNYYETFAKLVSGSLDQGTLGDSLVIKKYKGYYFLNFNEKPEWTLRVLHVEKNDDLILMALEDDGLDFNSFVKKLAKEIQVDSFEVNDEMLYQIAPEPKQLINLIKKGYFSKSVLKKVK